MTLANETIDIAAIYGPSHDDDPSFFQEVYDTLERRGNKNKLIIGDWNATLDRATDERGFLSLLINVLQIVIIIERNYARLITPGQVQIPLGLCLWSPHPPNQQ